MVKEVASKTADIAGDGTTATVWLKPSSQKGFAMWLPVLILWI